MDNPRIAVFLTTWFYSGLIPPILVKGMAGTYGSIAALPLCWGLIALSQKMPDTGSELYEICIFAVLFAGIFFIPTAEKALGPMTDWKGNTRTHDQNQIVIDEVFGMLLSCLPLEVTSRASPLGFTVALLAFRIFDTIKPPPARFFDKMPTAVGVMMDDGIAAAYAATVVSLFLWLTR